MFRLDRYVVKRDPMGNVTQIVTRENLSFKTLPEEMQQIVGDDVDADGNVSLYTAILLNDSNKWEIFQDINDTRVPNSEGAYEKDKSPFIPLRFSRVDGENYGRGYVEEYLGDLQSLESLTRAIVEGSAAAAKVLFLVNPNGTTRQRVLAEAPNGAIVQGSAQDVTTLQLQKGSDFQVAQATMNEIKDRLGHSFLLTSGVVRNAERVTAEEIRMLSQELETAIGGLYSLLSNELQIPLVNRIMAAMNKAKRLPKLPKDIVNPVIITGVEALGRGNDLQKLDLFLAGAAQVVGPQAVAEYVNVGEYFKRRAVSLGIKTQGLVKSDEEIQAMMQQQQQMQLTEKLGPAGIKAVSDTLESEQPV